MEVAGHIPQASSASVSHWRCSVHWHQPADDTQQADAPAKFSYFRQERGCRANWQEFCLPKPLSFHFQFSLLENVSAFCACADYPVTPAEAKPVYATLAAMQVILALPHFVSPEVVSPINRTCSQGCLYSRCTYHIDFCDRL